LKLPTIHHPRFAEQKVWRGICNVRCIKYNSRAYQKSFYFEMCFPNATSISISCYLCKDNTLKGMVGAKVKEIRKFVLPLFLSFCATKHYFWLSTFASLSFSFHFVQCSLLQDLLGGREKKRGGHITYLSSIHPLGNSRGGIANSIGHLAAARCPSSFDSEAAAYFISQCNPILTTLFDILAQ